MSSFPRLHIQPPSVDFVETRMPGYHAAFGNSLPRYDPVDNKYKVHEKTLVIMASERKHLRFKPLKPAPKARLYFRQQPVRCHLLCQQCSFGIAFYHNQCQNSRISHEIPEPKGRADSGYSIRTGRTSKCDNIRAQLERAQETYDRTDQGLVGRLKRGSRKAMKHGDGLRRIVQAILDVDIASSVFAVAKALRDVRRHDESQIYNTFTNSSAACKGLQNFISSAK